VTASSLARNNTITAKRRKRNRNTSTSNSNDDSNNSKNICNNVDDNKNDISLFKNTGESLAVISAYHTLNKRLEQNDNDTSITNAQRIRNADNLRKQQEEMGGLERYQNASLYGAKSSKFVCADWVVPFLVKQTIPNTKSETKSTGQSKLYLKQEQKVENEELSLNENKRLQKQKRNIRILDVGAIDNQYKKYNNWLDVVPIDLYGGQHESVLQVDFFDYGHEYCLKNDLAYSKAKPPTTKSLSTDDDDYGDKGKRRHKLPSSSSSSLLSSLPPQPFDAIVMSLVLNFQGDPRKRGDMIALAADPRLLRSDTKGMLFVALPSASLDNSRYCDLDRFVGVCKTLGFALIEKKRSLKLILLAFRRSDNEDVDGHNNDCDSFNKKRRQTQYYNAKIRTFNYGKHEMKRLSAKPGSSRNNFAVVLKNTVNPDI